MAPLVVMAQGSMPQELTKRLDLEVEPASMAANTRYEGDTQVVCAMRRLGASS